MQARRLGVVRLMDPAEVLPHALRERVDRDPDRTLLTEVTGETVTVGEFWERSRRWAGVLRAEGVGAGDTVLVMEPTGIRAYVLTTAVAMVGAIEVPINVEYVGGLLQHVVNNSAATVMVAAERYQEQILAAAGGFERLERLLISDARTVDDPGGHRVHVSSGLGAADDATPVDGPPPLEPWDPATILYTSGTTGPSKGVVVPWGQAHETAVGSAPPEAFGAPHSVVYNPYPTFHVSGKVTFYAVVLGGGRMVLRERFSTSSFWSDIRDHGCTSLILMGATANFIHRQPERPDDADNPLEIVVCSPWIPEIEAFKRRFDVRACSVFNMTEISSPIVAGWDGGAVDDPRVSGRARAGFDLRVVDDHDREVAAGEVGELLVRSREPWKLMSGYWRMPEKTVEAWRNLWFHTGDHFTVDEDGNYAFVGRKKDAIRRRGENISAAEVENGALEHPRVLEAAAVAIPDEVSEEEVKLSVTLHPGQQLKPAELAHFLAEHLPRFMVPRYIEVLEALPKTPTEKIQKALLREAGVGEGTWDRRVADV
jgi:carnitine-CoA ligase